MKITKAKFGEIYTAAFTAHTSIHIYRTSKRKTNLFPVIFIIDISYVLLPCYFKILNRLSLDIIFIHNIICTCTWQASWCILLKMQNSMLCWKQTETVSWFFFIFFFKVKLIFMIDINIIHKGYLVWGTTKVFISFWATHTCTWMYQLQFHSHILKTALDNLFLFYRTNSICEDLDPGAYVALGGVRGVQTPALAPFSPLALLVREVCHIVVKVSNRHKPPCNTNTNFRENRIGKLDHFQTARIVYYHLN